MFRSSLLLAFVSQASAAASTLIFLLVIRGENWASEFLHIYSWCALLSGSLNTALYFGVNRWHWIKSIHFSFLTLGLTSLVAYAGTSLTLQNFTFDLARFVLVVGLLAPLLMATKFGILFGSARKEQVFRLNILLNSALVLGILAATVFTHQRRDFYIFVGLISILVMLILLFFIAAEPQKVNSSSDSQHALVAVVNPALPVLERAVWDQWILTAFGLSEWAWWIYLLSRAITFIGGIIFTITTAKALEGLPNLGGNKRKFGSWIILIPFSVLLALSVSIRPTAFLLSSFLAWTLGVLLLQFSALRFLKFYKIILGVWFLDFLCRAILMALELKAEEYLSGLTIMNSLLFVVVLSFLIKQPKVIQ